MPDLPKFARRPGERAGLSTDTVLDTARHLLRDQGPDALSMRRIAAELGVLPNTLYSHVADKQALLDALVDQMLGEIVVPSGRTWRERVTGLLGATRATLLGEPVLAMLYVQRAGRGPNAVRLAQQAMQIYHDAGVPPTLAEKTFRVLIAYTVGFVAFELGRADPDGQVGPLPANSRLDGLDQSLGDIEFDLGVEWLLDGLTAMMDEPA